MQWTYYAVLEAFLNPIIFIMKMRIRKPFEALERERKANKVNHNGFEIISDGEFIERIFFTVLVVPQSDYRRLTLILA